MNKKIKHVFFDLDHTLWDFDKNSELTFEKIFNIHNVDIELNDFLEIYVPINFKYWKLYREEKVTKTQLRFGRLKDAFDALRVEVSDDLINTLSEDYINYLSNFNNVFEGAHDILDYLSTNYTLHIITNGFAEAQDKKIKASKMSHYFKTITNSEMVGVKKPNPKIFNYALQQADASPEESIMIGDSVEADIEGALNVGIDTIYFDYKNVNSQKQYKRITELKAIKDFL